MGYAISSINAAKLAAETNTSPIEAWEKSVKEEFPHSMNSQLKCCPKNAFLGLCEDGYVKGIKPNKYTRSNLNKQYGIIAVQILGENKTKSYTSLYLWKEVLKRLNADRLKQHNNQMNVVLALWNEGLIKMPSLPGSATPDHQSQVF